MEMTRRVAKVERKTLETEIALTVCLDGEGKCAIDTGIGFFNHMLTLMTRHALFDLDVRCRGDVDIDGHHTVEDVAICLGEAIAKALGDKKGITRYGFMLLPMDEALARVALDLSGRACLEWRATIPAAKCGDFDTALIREFMRGLCGAAGINLHVELSAGIDPHHCLEAIFKALGRSLRQAVMADPRETGIPSSKGVL